MLAEVQLGLGDYAVIGGMMAAINGVVLAYVRSVSGRVDRMEVRVQKVEQEKVSQKDWLRIVASQANRQNEMGRMLAEMSGKLDATLGITAGLNRIAEAVKTRTDDGH